MAGTLQEGSNSVYLFNPDPSKEPCTLSMLEKYPELCRNIGWEGVSDGGNNIHTEIQATR